MYIKKLDDVVNKYKNTFHSTIKMKPVDVKPSINFDFNKENKNEGPKIKAGDHVRTSKYKNIFAKDFFPNWSEEVFVITKVKNTVPWTYVISDLKGEEIVGTFYKEEFQTANQEKFRDEKVINRKGDKLYVKWKDYDNYFDSLIDKKRSCYIKMICFLPYSHSKNKIEVELGLSNYATKSNLKNATGVDTSQFAKKVI